MADRILFNLSDATPAAPAGKENVAWQGDGSAVRNISANVPKQLSAARFLIVGGPVAAADDIAGHYRVVKAGTIISLVGSAKSAITGDCEFDIRVSANEGSTWQSILGGSPANYFTIPNGSTAKVSETDFEVETLSVDNLLRLDLKSGSAYTLELVLTWR